MTRDVWAKRGCYGYGGRSISLVARPTDPIRSDRPWRGSNVHSAFAAAPSTVKAKIYTKRIAADLFRLAISDSFGCSGFGRSVSQSVGSVWATLPYALPLLG